MWRHKPSRKKGLRRRNIGHKLLQVGISGSSDNRHILIKEVLCSQKRLFVGTTTKENVMCDINSRGYLFHGLPPLNRRSFLRNTSLATLTLAVPAGMLGGAAHAAGSTINAVHGQGFCNLNFFLANAAGTAKEDGVDLNLIPAPTFADMVNMLAAGQIDAGIMPYTTFLSLTDAGIPVKIVAGGGVGGLAMVAQPGLDANSDFKGKTVGTFQNDTVEILAYEWLKKKGVSFNDIKVQYFGTVPELMQAFIAGQLDIVAFVEPYGSVVMKEKPGTVLLSDGIDIFGQNYTDCILGVRAGLTTENPDGIKSLIKGMMRAQLMAETDPDGVLKQLIGTYYKTTYDLARVAMTKQHSIVDARGQEKFILARGQSMLELGYIKKQPDNSSIDWTALEQVIAENPDIYSKLKNKKI
jgi:NitT/TauT family transport system substrate-binding protein